MCRTNNGYFQWKSANYVAVHIDFEDGQKLTLTNNAPFSSFNAQLAHRKTNHYTTKMLGYFLAQSYEHKHNKAKPLYIHC